MPEAHHKGGKKNRKFDRNRTRSPAMKRYRAENREAANKKRKIAKHQKAMRAAAEKKEARNESAHRNT